MPALRVGFDDDENDTDAAMMRTIPYMVNYTQGLRNKWYEEFHDNQCFAISGQTELFCNRSSIC
jgi:hypothetical protein